MRRLLLLSICVFALLGGVSSAAPPMRVATGELRAEMDRDPRLARPIKLSHYRIFLGELLEQISNETGVTLETDERRQPLSGYELAVVAHGRPAWEILEAVARMYSYPPERWYWSRTSRSGRAVYTLHNTLPAAELLRMREEQAVSFLLKELRRRRAFYALPGPQRATTALTDPELQAINNPSTEGAFTFLGSLSEAQLRSILRGQPLNTPAERFSDGQRRYLIDLFERQNTRERMDPMVLEGKRAPIEHRLDEVKETVLARDESMGGLFAISLKAGPTKTLLLGGFSLLKALREQPNAAWRTADELAPAPERTVPVAGRKPRPDELGPQNDAPDRVLERLGQAGGINLVYDRPVMRTWTFYRVFRTSLEGELPKVLEGLEAQNLIWKRKEPLLMFRLADWLSNRRDVLLPWSFHRAMRDETRTNGGYLGLDGLVRLAVLRPEQQEYLRGDFPDLAYLMRDAELGSLLQFASLLDDRGRAALSSPLGSGWDDWSNAARKQAEATFGKEPARTLRIKAQVVSEPAKPPRLKYGISTDGTAPQLKERPLLRSLTDPGTLYPLNAGTR